MNHLLLALAGVLFVECLLRLRLLARLQDFQMLARRLLAVLASSRISDHWKERVIPHYAGRLMLLSLSLFGCLLLALLPAALVAYGAEAMGRDFLAWSASLWALLEATAIAAGYVFLRQRAGH